VAYESFRFLQIYKDRVEKKEISGNYVKTIKLFCEMNEILIPWKKITRGLPRGRKFAPVMIRTFTNNILEYSLSHMFLQTIRT
jgi:hypothetical protein